MAKNDQRYFKLSICSLIAFDTLGLRQLLSTATMEHRSVSNREGSEQQVPPGRAAPDSTRQIQRLQLSQLVSEMAMSVKLPRKRSGLTPVARDKYGVPIIISNRAAKVGTRRRRAQGQTEPPYPRSPTSIARRPLPVPLSVPAPAAFSADSRQSKGDRKDKSRSNSNGNRQINDNDNGNDNSATASDIQVRAPGSGGKSGETNRGQRGHAGKLTLISADQLEDLRADLIQSARENSDLRHEVDMLERKLARAEDQRETYWACGVEWARREKGLQNELEHWRAQGEAATKWGSAIEGAATYGFVGGRGFGGRDELDEDQGQGSGLGLQFELGFNAEDSGTAFDTGFDTDFGTNFGAHPGLFTAAGGGEELDEERDAMM
ncbi:uncharacterized protein Z519_05689 [Cladophialophora bantiana CBS 173.52]|uniref:Uncharacterized protein n=1 Tax=Cladophialophora bantiana (strain ATCC 10958 / CBS 173.52 / CDC B-1940 / NIH 8579) TaxID=1442370 RepID=A0A0D2I8E7_CLAB1|nr:uncharacterized protein Z519_05689 [Cladophialophora bantiana CBS 173.52]KIW93084.1 hypothetical protein Z519_05689 [Cladophialophora bantiana CBS 173.52]